MKYYFQQIFYQFRTQPVILTISVLGTALSIAFIMLYIMMEQVYITPFAPESNRDRTLHIIDLYSDSETENLQSGGGLGEIVIRECFYPLQSAERVTAYMNTQSGQVSLPGGKHMHGSKAKGTDAAFWDVFNFTFIQGGPYTDAEVNSAVPKAVLDENTARSLWGTTDVVGREFALNHFLYRVAGVVHPVSSQAFVAESKVWVPYTTLDRDEWRSLGLHSSLVVSLLAKDKDDFPAIRQECEKRIERFNEETLAPIGWRVSLYAPESWRFEWRAPYDQRELSSYQLRHAISGGGLSIVIFLLLLLIPAVNLSAMLNSRLRQQRQEIGVRRSFGATRFRVMQEMFTEGLLITLLGGLLGLLICFGISYAAAGHLFPLGEGIEGHTLITVMFNWRIFAYTLLACVVLNLLSCLVPVWEAVRVNIVDTLGGRNG